MDLSYHTFTLLICSFLFCSCSKLSYIIEQGGGQIRLLTSARDNSWVKNDESIPQVTRDKVEFIEELKDYFEEYWSFDTGRIYTRTTFLDRPAVTYLLIASPVEKVKANRECFPFVGCFPYIGFFSLNSARRWAEKYESRGLETHIRPVYAYSTLGYFSDTILSSFFHFDDFTLADLIFHELFHVMFFIKNDVGLNEALASYFAREMTYDFFDLDKDEIKQLKFKDDAQKKISQDMVDMVKLLNQNYKEGASKKGFTQDKESLNKVRKKFLSEIFYPHFRSRCRELSLEKQDCFPLNRDWNNASLAAFMTYNDLIGPIEALREKKELDLRGLYEYIYRQYQLYRKKDGQKRKTLRFSDFLFL